MSIEYVIVLTTLPTEANVDLFASTLVESRLAACVSILSPVDSVYRWQDKVERASEWQVVMKTTRDRAAALQERVRELHPYDVPELLVVPVIDGHEPYLRWIADSTR